MLNIQHFTKTYGEKKAVDDLSLHIAPGEIYGFIGHNGAGKTTTLKAAVGILQFDAGEITIGGHSIKTEPLACKQLLAYIPDNPDLYDFMSGIQYLNFIADIFGIPAAERWARIEPYADAFELTGDLGQPISAYSHGMKIRGSAYLLYLFGCVGAGDWLAMLIVTVTQALLLALTMWGIARSFLKIATATGSVKKVRFEHKAVRAQSTQRALLGKELRRFTASPNYMLNCGFGILMLTAAGIALLIKGRALAQLLDGVFGAGADIVPVLLSAALCLLASMNDMAAPSVSLEGRQLWLAQSLPVTPWQVLRAKLDVQLVLTGVPMLFCALCAVITLPGGAAEMALAVVVALLYTLLSALAALALGLRLPNLTWTNEITPIKQGGSVMLALFANWFYAIALGGLYFLCGRYLSAAAYLALAAAITAAVCALLLRWVKQRGTRIFAAL